MGYFELLWAYCDLLTLVAGHYGFPWFLMGYLGILLWFMIAAVGLPTQVMDHLGFPMIYQISSWSFC